MARKIEALVISDEGRDKGKTFILTEMPAYAGIKWADRCLLAMAAGGAALPDGALGSGVMGLLVAGISSLDRLSYSTLEPLLDELLSCAQYQHAPNLPPQAIFAGNACQVEEIKTFWTIRIALFKLHTGFSGAASTQVTA